MKMAARIRRVLTGHSPVALVHAVTGDGLELKLEVPAKDAIGVGLGDVLVLEWDTFHLDDAPPIEALDEPLKGDSEELVIDDASAAAEVSDSDPATVTSAVAPSTSHATVRRMLGLPT